MKRFIATAVLLTAFIKHVLFADIFAGFTVFANHAVDVVPNWETGKLDQEADNLFGSFDEKDWPEMKTITSEYYRRHGTAGDSTNLLRTAISTLQRIRQARFPRPLTGIMLFYFTDGLENVLTGSAYTKALKELEQVRAEAESSTIPIYSYVVEVCRNNSYSTDINRKEYKTLLALSGDPSRIYKLTDFKDENSAVDKVLSMIAESNGEYACYFVIDRSPSLRGADPDVEHAMNVVKDRLFENSSETPSEIRTDFVEVKPGEFIMGSDNHDDDEAPAHKLAVDRFFLGKMPVTESLYHSTMSPPDVKERYKDSRKPITNISWFDAVRFCNRLSEIEGRQPAYRILDDGAVTRISGSNGYRLPTEAEMQYAARAGGAAIEQVVSKDTFNLSGEVSEVGRYSPNAWGLYDVTGLVRQWCEENYDVYRQATGYAPPASGATKVLYGAGFKDKPERYRLTYRFFHRPDFYDEYVGMRLAYSE